jgi:acetolactate synthase-1/2/3 large subunit
MPVIVITGQKPIKTSKQGQFQIIDVVGMMRPITKYATTVISGSKLPYIMHNAFAIATAERPGAVHIELPEDIAEEQVENYIPLSFTEKVRRPQIDEKALEHLVNELSQAKTPLILIGAGANRKRVSKYLTKFITKYNIPFFCSQMGKGVVDESLPQYIGTAALTQNDFVHTAIAHADLILSVGYDPIEKPTTLLGAGGTKTIHINYYETSHDYVYHPYLEIIGDIGNTFRQLSDNVDISQARDFSQVYAKSAEYLSKLDHDYLQEHIGNGIM